MGILFSFFFLFFFNKKWNWELRFWFIMIFSFLFMKNLMVDGGVYMYYFYLDYVSSILVLLSLWTSGLMLLSSYYSVKINNNKIVYFSFCVLMLCFVIILFFVVENLLLFYLFFEVSLIPTLLLILGWGYQPERLQAGMYMMLYTVSASLPLLLCILMIGYREGIYSMNMFMLLWLNDMNMFWFFGLLLAFLVKLPMYFFHLWLPKAHVEAPISGSMILASVLLKLGGYGFMRFLMLFNFVVGDYMKLLVVICLWGGILTSIICVGQSDMKSLIAYSSIGHMGVMLVGLLSGFIVGWEGALLMMISHGLCSSGLFCAGNLIYEKMNSRSLYLCGGMINFNPMMSLFMFLLCICNMGAPPFVSLMSEIMLYISMYMYSFILLFFVIIMVFMGGLYNLLFYVVLHHGQIMSFMKVVVVMKSSESLLLVLHIIPLLVFILNIGYMSKVVF
uniref:NADH-ubiquinone oxidoreductase chain 4 n=2 Tax=Octopodidae TaxID=6647 RepID=A0A7T5Y0Q4_ENTDO|nr:NADH dehydrogenase subunit 4 [Octopus conispadiceus]YP_010132629.1 NADH dehydrogenase subunit 4 [Enteroctopus dofleini]AIJ03117.1 NADH dehydrogenase subunit 4 [Octopus conispadiceus]QQH14298.1 NADH dehydrogenase subunit 4 [Enteroctopus dofleini]WIA66150.1 NADH dehydrogenase subunit 4 [Enteroctopus dofleini]